jgi:iron complex transport system substrate-binding protein
VQPEKEELPAYPLTIIDDTGRKVPIQKLPQRIVSLAPSNTEILFALGLDDKIVGTTDYCDYPQAAKTKPRVAGYSNPNIEKLLSLEPDLVVAESIHERMVLPALERLGLTVVVTRATSLEVVLHDIELLGQITGRSKAATQIVTSMKARIDAIVSKTSTLTPEQRPRVLYVCWHAPIWTMGSETFIDDLIWKAGGMNVFAADFKQSRAVSLEAVVTKNPEVIIVSGMGTAGDLIYNAILREERLKDVDAIISHRVYKMSDASLIERPGPRIVDGLEEVAKYIHPEIFGKGQASQR